MPSTRAERETIEEPTPAEERELVRRLGEGDGSALKRLLRLHWDVVVRYALHVVGSRDQAEDVAQEAFIRLWRYREQWRRTDTVRPILYRITRNLALNEVRRRGTLDRLVSRIRASGPAADPAPGPFQAVVSAELESAMRRAVDGLPERRREIFVLVRFHRMSHREAGKVLGISPQTVANQMSLALADLHAALDPHLEGDSSQHIDFPSALARARTGRTSTG